MINKLGNIAQIQTGVFRQPKGSGEIIYLQARHFSENGQLSSTLYPDLEEDKSIHKHLLQDGDVLFAAKGNKNFAALYEYHNQPAVASTTFFVIRLLPSYISVLPAFIKWFLNHPSTQSLLKKEAIGSSLASISKSVLMDLEIPIPSIAIQQSILKIEELRFKEKEIGKKIELVKEKHIQNLILKSLKIIL